jgi:SAM-dependent methyltransferase
MPGRWHDAAMDREMWDARYAATESLWSFEPNRFLVRETEALAPGRALDLAGGEGRNALWLAARGWQVTVVDFSAVALDRGRARAERDGLTVEWLQADVLRWAPPERGFDLVAILYLHLREAELQPVLRRAADAVAPAGTLLVVAHDATNLTDGHGGPQDPELLYTPADVTAAIDGLEVVRAEQVARPVSTPAGERTAIDALVRAVRPA